MSSFIGLDQLTYTGSIAGNELIPLVKSGLTYVTSASAIVPDGSINSAKINNTVVINISSINVNSLSAISAFVTTTPTLPLHITNKTYVDTASAAFVTYSNIVSASLVSYVNAVSANQKAYTDTKAPINNATFTGTTNGITKTMVGLGNVDNTSDVNKPVSTAQQTALNLKQNLLGFTPVQQGTGSRQGANIVKLGWTGASTLAATIDATDVGDIMIGTGSFASKQACKAWYNADAAASSYNISSITTDGVSNRFNFTTSMPNTTYSVILGGWIYYAGYYGGNGGSSFSRTTGYVEVSNVVNYRNNDGNDVTDVTPANAPFCIFST